MTTLGPSTDSDCRRSWLLPCAMSAQARGRDGIVAIATLCALLWLMPSPASAQRFPATRKLALADTLYGTPVPDPYRWLENSDSAEVVAWFRAQGAHTRAALEALPGRTALLERMRTVRAATPPEMSLPREAGGRWFYTMRRPTDPVARGYVRDAWTGEERVLVDPATVARGGATGANTLARFTPSPDGRLVLYGVTSGGSEEDVALRVRDVASGRDVDGPFERNRYDANVWSPDGRTFLYVQTRDLPRGSAPADHYRGIRILRHRLGEDAASDVAVFSAALVGENDRLFPVVEIDARSGLAFAIVTTGVERHAAHFVGSAAELSSGTPEWRRLFGFADSVVTVAAYGADLYALTLKGAPLGRIVRTRLDDPDLSSANTVLAESDQNLRWMSAALDAIYVDVFSNGANRVTRIPWGGNPVPIALPLETSVSQSRDDPSRSQLRADPLRSGALLNLESWTSASRAYHYDPSTDDLRDLRLRPPGTFDSFDGHVAETVFAPSHDGVRIPLTIVRPRQFERNGSLPVLLWGYGAYGFTDAPNYIVERYAWYESGGTSATCHVRGGGYHGEAWRQAGQKATKPNTWLDFIACAEYLIRENYTSPARLVAFGGSAGGVTVGRAITDRPDLFSGAIIQNGVLDAVRSETTANGVANIPEFGSVSTAEGFRGLHAMSALHHVRQGTAYPAVLLITGLNDIRVESWHSGKMAAALQAATTSGRPVLLRVDEAGGHMPGELTQDQLTQLVADVYAFTMAQTGLPPYQVRTGRQQ